MKTKIILIVLLAALSVTANVKGESNPYTEDNVQTQGIGFLGSWGEYPEDDYVQSEGWKTDKSSENKHDLMIKQYDTDGDGTLSDTEKTAMEEARKAEFIKKFDTDGDGSLSDAEKEAAEAQRPKRGPKGGKGGPDKQQMIKQYDTDGDGTLSDTEKTAMEEARKAEFIKKFDTDGDGSLSDAEKEAAEAQRPKRGKRGNRPGRNGKMKPRN